MLSIHIKPRDLFNEKTNEFIPVKGGTLKLEHSLVSISKWESKWKIPFLSKKPKTKEQIDDYIRCMSVNGDPDPNLIASISTKDKNRIIDYIEEKQTATWFTNLDGKRNTQSDIITSERIYYWMIVYQIPHEYEKWHLSRLLTLIEICNRENTPPKNMTQAEIIARNKALNAERKAKLHSRG